MNYEEKIVSDDLLRNSVLCYWQMTGHVNQGQGVDVRHTPKGQSLLVFNFGDEIELLDTPGVVMIAPSVFLLPAFASSRIFNQKGNIDLFGVTFIADGLYHFVQQPISKLRDQFPVHLKDSCNELFSLLAPLDFHAKVKKVNLFLKDQIKVNNRTSSFQLAYHYISQTKGCVKVNEVAQMAHVTERQLQRLFRTRLGISPKDYCKIIRVNSYIEFILTNKKVVDWMELVVEFNYHDQPHLINEVKSITKLSPQKLISFRDTLYDLYSY